jgi:hypothetical protein
VLFLQSIVSEFNIKYDDWMYGSFTKLDAELIDECINEWFKYVPKSQPLHPLAVCWIGRYVARVVVRIFRQLCKEMQFDMYELLHDGITGR